MARASKQPSPADLAPKTVLAASQQAPGLQVSRTRPAPPPPPKSVVENVKETLESIVVAFILAFVFRAFVVEAFVIPTGSMAVTLYGNQATNTCSVCGYEYARGVSDQDVEAALRTPAYEGKLRCPNCDTMVDHIPRLQVLRPDSGDRILVQKWAWSLGLSGEAFQPQPWDVTVFKDPRDGTTNFIKRMVGLPGHVLEIIDGDVYTVPVETLAQNAPGVVEALDDLRRRTFEYGQHPQPARYAEFIQDYNQINQRLLPHLRISRKAERAQQSLWTNVYNHDYLPAAPQTGIAPSRVGWEPQGDAARAAWDTSSREIRFASDADLPLSIAFVGKPIDDFGSYNVNGPSGRSPAQTVPVGDLRLRFVWILDGGQGGIRLQMNRDKHIFTADIAVDGSVRLVQQVDDEQRRPQVLGEKTLDRPLRPGQTVSIEFSVVDFQVVLTIDGRAIIEAPYPPDLKRGMEISLGTGDPVQPSNVLIGARQMKCRLRHVILERDVYYRSTRQEELEALDPVTHQRVANAYCGQQHWPGWGTAGHPILLRAERTVDGRTYPGEYFMLGDNSAASKDSRLWWEIGPHLKGLGEEYQVGTVPEDQLIGKAFFVYWPAGYRPAWAGGIGLVPNFGRMRWIR